MASPPAVPEDHLLAVYARAPLAFERGEGARLWSTDGEDYLDCLAGIATTGLGHANPKLVAALKAQAEKLWHVSNIFRIPEQEALATGAADGRDIRRPGVLHQFRHRGGGMRAEDGAQVSLGGRRSRPDRDHRFRRGLPRPQLRRRVRGRQSGNTYVEGFGPALPGYRRLPFGDSMEALEAARGETIAAVILEPVQGEGGARALPEADLDRLRQLFDERGALLIYDEIQCGLGRTGKLFAHEWATNAAPDIMCVAKALGGGFPVGACLATARVAASMAVGSHGSTYGGNPLAMAVGIAAFDEIARPENAPARQ